jgi:superfamily I DNA/RNA helicase
VKEMLDTLADTAARQNPAERLQLFLDDISLDADREEEQEAGDAVTLITIHSCKGLEFRSVYIVGMEEGLLPHARSKVEGPLTKNAGSFMWH